MNDDRQYSVDRCQSGLSAAQALICGAKAGERSFWVGRERYWKLQLGYALAREGGDRPAY